MIYKT